MKHCLTLLLFLFSVYFTENSFAQSQSTASLITKQQGWLNTSRPLKAEDLKSRIILLDFWTYGCINCMHIIPDMEYLEQKFGNDLTIIGVHSAKFKNESDTKNISKAIQRYDIRHAVVNDFDFSTWKAFGVRAWPTLILINPDGDIVTTYSGEGHRDALEKDIKKLRVQFAGKINNTPLPLALEMGKQKPSILSFPSKIATGEVGGVPVLFIADSGHQRIVVTTLEGAIIDTIGSGKEGRDDGDFASASFNTPRGLAYKNNILYIADTKNNVLRAADVKKRTVTTLPSREFSSPWDVAFYPDDNHLAIAMAGVHQIWSYDITEQSLSVIAGNGREAIDDGRLPVNSLAQTSGVSSYEGKLYFVDAESSSLRVLDNGNVTTLIGSGLFDFGFKEGKKGAGQLQHPQGLYASKDGIFIADSYNHALRRYDLASGVLYNVSAQRMIIAIGNKNTVF
jgi:thiol-disulfide isomerase/thioredoxin